MRVSPDARKSQYIKVVRSLGLSYVVLYVTVEGPTTTVKLLDVSPLGIETLFKFEFIDSAKMPAKLEEDAQVAASLTEIQKQRAVADS